LKKEKTMAWNIETSNKILYLVQKVCDLEKTYGGPQKDSQEICRHLKTFLAERYSAEQVLWALENLIRENTRVPLPSEIETWLNPEKKKISTQEYLQAKRDFERNGRNEFSKEGILIKEYHDQDDQRNHQLMERRKNIELLGYSGHNLKKIDGNIEYYSKEKSHGKFKKLSEYTRVNKS